MTNHNHVISFERRNNTFTFVCVFLRDVYLMHALSSEINDPISVIITRVDLFNTGTLTLRYPAQALYDFVFAYPKKIFVTFG